MASSFEKSVKGATKIKAAPPKTKYIEHILIATHAGEAGVAEVFRALQNRLRDSTWTVVFKSLITVHLMVREGSPDSTLAYLARHRSMLATSSFTDAQTQGRNIRHYAAYLTERARAYRDTKTDWVRTKETRLEKLSVDKGLLRETEVVQHQLTALLKCDVLDEPENEITITVFRLLVLDLLSLFQVLNQAMINILGHFFEMSKPDAERAMEIYRTFARQTDFVVQYLQVARQYEHHTRVEIPKLKHAPVNLGRQLEDYLKDSDFEVHRRQYLAEMDVKKPGGSSSKAGKSDAAVKGKPFPDSKTNGTSTSTASKPAAATKGPAPDLIDFFDSIEQNQQTMAADPQQQQQQQQPQQFAQASLGNPWASNSPFNQVPQQTGQPFQGTDFVSQQPDQQFQGNGFAPQPTGFAPQPTGFANNSPFPQQSIGAFSPQQQQVPQQIPQQVLQQQAFTGSGFGGFGQQQGGFTPGGLSSIPQDSVASFQTGVMAPPMQTGLQPGQQTTNPFRQSMLMANPTGMASPTPNFTNTTIPSPATQLQRQSTNPFARSSPGPFSGQPSQSPFQPQQPQQAQTAFQPQQLQAPAPQPLQPMQTGTNPFAKNFGGGTGQQLQRPQTSGALMPQPTGSTNPFRQGDFMNHETGQGWQHNQGRIGGGFDEIQSTPVFPRPSTSTAWQT
ncbi:ANTH domain-containing protein [Truncatella angustata]|uniref:ANTH domain-containing protein n=1 Tax=Truncatella angustata TaxID=152316 RepID=A0A9P8URY9_9PEZI|nr:ANTH domain-containing protein [Truncatella angustata]KAH6657253.1 ANTH domain-containing protein [Truncatella angustata]